MNEWGTAGMGRRFGAKLKCNTTDDHQTPEQTPTKTTQISMLKTESWGHDVFMFGQSG